MNAVATIINRFRGVGARATYTASAAITSLGTTAYDIGDTLNESSMPLVLTCLGPSAGSTLQLRHIRVVEYVNSGAAQHPAMKLYFLANSYMIPPQNSPFWTPTIGTDVLTIATIETIGWNDFSATGGTPAYSQRTKDITDCWLTLPAGQSTLYVGVQATGTPEFAADANLKFYFVFEC